MDPCGFRTLLGDCVANAEDPQPGPPPAVKRERRDGALPALVALRPNSPPPAPWAWEPTPVATATPYVADAEAAPTSDPRGTVTAHPPAKAQGDSQPTGQNGPPENSQWGLLMQLPAAAPSSVPDNPQPDPPAGPQASLPAVAENIAPPSRSEQPLQDPESNQDSFTRAVHSPARDASVRGISAGPEAGTELAFTARMRLPEPDTAGGIPPAAPAPSPAAAAPPLAIRPEAGPESWRKPAPEVFGQNDQSAATIPNSGAAQNGSSPDGEPSQHKNDPQPTLPESTPPPPAWANDVQNPEATHRALPTTTETGHPISLSKKPDPDAFSGGTHNSAPPPAATDGSGKMPVGVSLTAESPATPASGPAPAPTAAPAADARTASDANSETPPQLPQGVSHDVALRLASGPNSVDIRMAERAGEIRVTVHTLDHSLADSLRAGLPDLVDRLRQTGYQAEAWHPQPGQSRRGGEDASSFQQHSPGGGQDGRHPPPQQPQPRKNQPRWAGEWNLSLDPAEEHER